MNDSQKSQLFNNIADSMDGVSDEVKQRALKHFEKIDTAYAKGVIEALDKKCK